MREASAEGKLVGSIPQVGLYEDVLCTVRSMANFGSTEDLSKWHSLHGCCSHGVTKAINPHFLGLGDMKNGEALH